MLVVKTIAKIRRAYSQDRELIKQICRDLRVSRNTVCKLIRSGATEFTYERSVQPQPKNGLWRDELDRMLAENARKPKQNGFVESFNARLRDELPNVELFHDLREAKILIEQWRRHYNTVRPHIPTFPGAHHGDHYPG